MDLLYRLVIRWGVTGLEEEGMHMACLVLYWCCRKEFGQTVSAQLPLHKRCDEVLGRLLVLGLKQRRCCSDRDIETTIDRRIQPSSKDR